MTITNLAAVLPLIPLFSLPIYMVTKNTNLHHGVNIFINALTFLICLLLAKEVLLVHTIEIAFTHTYLDGLNIILLLLTTFLTLLISIYAVNYLNGDVAHHKITKTRIRIFYMLTNIFAFTMLLALTTGNIGIMWIAVEATTLASAFLVGFYNRSRSIEAAWKYIMICSVGIALAFIGIILIHLSSLSTIHEEQYLNLPFLLQSAQLLDTQTLRLAFIFVLIGFGTKAGLAPMHSWLPGAHSQAPSPISALLSGVLLNTAMYPIIRTTALLNINTQSTAYTATPLLILAVLSILVASYLIITQREYKSLLAYSSIEHMGIIALALAIHSPLAIYGALLHIINHSLTKTMLFLTTGNILHIYQNGEISNVKALLKVSPFTGVAFLIGLFAIAGTPPFSIFTSEFTILTAIFQEGSFILGAVLAVLLAIIFSSIIYTISPIFYGKKDDTCQTVPFKNISGNLVILFLMISILISGLFTPQFLVDLVTLAQQAILL